MTADITIVVGAQNAKSTIVDCLNSLVTQTRELNAQLVVADASTDGTDSLVATKFPQITLMRGKSDALVPDLWGIGMQEAQAPVVAITTAHCIPHEDWVKTILAETAAHKCAGVGGPISAPSNGKSSDWAVYFSRYSAFMPPAQKGQVADVPGDNAAYRKDALDRHWLNKERGFWETLFHNQLRKSGEALYMVPSAQVELGHTDNPFDYCRVRYQHGFHYGSTRPGTNGVVRILRILSAPVLMPYLVLRIGRRIAEKRPDWLGRYTQALPWLIIYMLSWSFGETVGYLNPARDGHA